MVWGILAIMSMNIVDTFYVGQLGPDPLAAMGFTIPIVSILLGLAFGIGIGTSSVISRAIGAKEIDAVRSYATQSIIIAIVVAITFAIVGYHNIDAIFRQLGAPDHLMPLIHQYMDVWFLGSFIVIVPMVGNSAIRASGNTKLPGLVMIGVSIVNIILDPILIFGLFGFPRLELAGAALATIAAYSFALVTSLYLLIFRYRFLSLHACYRKVSDSWKAILSISIPAIGTNLIAPLSVAITTWMVAHHSPEAVAGFGVATRIESMLLVVMMGLSSITGPFVGQNWGAQRYDRVAESIRISFRFVAIWGVAVACFLWLFAYPISGLFADEESILESASLYLYIMPITYAFLGMIMVSSSTANGKGDPKPSLVMSFLRLLAVYIPLAWLLSTTMGLPGIYLAGALANIVVGFVAIYWVRSLKLQAKMQQLSN